MGVGRAVGGAARSLVFVELLDDGQQALGLGGFADFKHPVGARLWEFGGHRGDDLTNGRRLIRRAKHHQPVAGGIGVQGCGLGGASLVLFGVDLVDHGQQVGGSAALGFDGVQLALRLIRACVERRDDRLHLRHERIGGQHDESAAIGFRGDAHQVGH